MKFEFIVLFAKEKKKAIAKGIVRLKLKFKEDYEI